VIGMAEAAQRAFWRFDREQWARAADGLAVALAATLPWSTSATGILAVLWIIALVPTLDRAVLRDVLSRPAGYLPVVFWLLGLTGMLWAVDVPWAERVNGLDSFHKLLAIPLLIAQFTRSNRVVWVLYGYLAGCALLLAVSWTLFFLSEIPWRGRWQAAIPVKDYIAQAAELTVGIFLLANIAVDKWRERQRAIAFALAALALAFLANIFFIATSRTALVVLPVLLVLFACKQLPWKGTFGLLLAALVVAAMAWWLAPNVRMNVTGLVDEIRTFQPQGENTRAGERMEYWSKSVGFVSEAPLLGHGTGSIRAQFTRSAEGQTGMAALRSANPHQQTLAVAIQLGLIGAAVLWAMWIAHALVFRGEGLAAWAGLVVVAQNVVGSLFNTHLFDFTHGWLYAIGVGVAAGAVLRQAATNPDSRPTAADVPR
jgi:O-antigen ligase